MKRPSHGDLLRRAKAMRGTPTDAERKLWSILRAKRLSGYKFKRQQPVGSFIVDFICVRQRLIVEADGGHHSTEEDAVRNAYLKAKGYRILRFWNNDILINPEGVTTSIADILEGPSPQPLSPRERG